MNLSYLKKTFTPQLENSDCGVACLRSVVRYYGGDVSLERLRELSGTNKQGTTLLGLFQAGQKLGLETEGYTAEIENLKEQTAPVILNVLIDNTMQHYWVCYSYEAGKGFLVGDPAKGIDFYSEKQVSEAWKSKGLLTLAPTEGFEKQALQNRKKWTWLWDLVQEDLTLLIISAILGIAIAGLGLSTAIFSQKLIDDILPSQNHNKLIYGVTLLAFLLSARTGLSYLRGFLLNKQSADFNNRIINRFFGILLYLPKPFFDTRKTGELVARMNDTRRIQNTISFLAGNVIIDILVVGISTFYIFQYQLMIGLIALLSIPIYFLLMRVYHASVRDSQREVMSAYAKNESNYIDTIQGIATVKSMNKEPVFEQITKLIYGFFQQKIYALGLVRIRLSFWAELGSVVLIVSIIGYCAFLVLEKSLKTGEMMAVLGIVGSLIPSVSRLAMLNIELQEAKIAFERMFEFIGLNTEYQLVSGGGKKLITNELYAPPKPSPEERALNKLESLEIRNLNFRFTGRGLILENISFQMHKGEIVALTGESGSGKSTILQILQRFYYFESGEILVNQQHSWQEIDTKTWRDLIGIVPQEMVVFSGTLLDNICLGDTQKEAESIIHFCQKYGFSKYFEAFPQSYFTLVGEEHIHLSGGQKQLLALARALYRQPQLLLLDEATSAMDTQMEKFVLALLDKLKSEMIILMVTHKNQIEKVADRIVKI